LRISVVIPLLAAAAASCGHVFRAGALSPPAGASPEIAAACQLTSDRCARCHPLARVELARVQSAQHWDWYVSRMRLQPRSGITLEEQPTIVRCLVARSFGVAALEGLPK
jgi:hypothetical protein